VWARRKADEATMLGWRGKVALALISLAPLGAGWVFAWPAARELRTIAGATAFMLGGPGISALLLVILPFAAAFRSRKPEARLVTAWRGNLRGVLPLAAVGLALISLGLVMASRTTEVRWAQEWMSKTEMERVVEAIGPEWHNPRIPPDAWRDEPAPEAASG